MGLYEINRERHFEWLENQRRFHENKKIKEDRSLGRTPKSFDAVSRGTTVLERDGEPWTVIEKGTVGELNRKYPDCKRDFYLDDVPSYAHAVYAGDNIHFYGHKDRGKCIFVYDEYDGRYGGVIAYYDDAPTRSVSFYMKESNFNGKKIKEMGMRKLSTIFNPPHINKLIRIINKDIKAAFGKNGLKPEVTFDEKLNQDTCYIEFEKPLVDDYGKNFIVEAENYLKGEKVELTKISGDPETLSAIASIAYCIDYDKVTFVSTRKVALVNPEVTTYSPQLVTPIKENYNKNSKRPKIAEEKVYYGIFSDTGYGPRSSEIVNKIKKRILSDCYECISNPDHDIYRDDGSIYGLFDNREEAANAIRSRRDDEAYSSRYSRGYYRTAYIVAKCNENGELIMSVRDFYDPSLWETYPSEDEIRECIEIYNASILNKGANE